MTHKTTILHFTRNLLQIGMEMAAIYPLLVLLDAYWLGTNHPVYWALLFLALTGMGSVLRQLSTIKAKVICVIPYLVLGVGSVYPLGTDPAAKGWIAGSILGMLVLLRGVRIAAVPETERERLLPIRLQLIMLGLTWLIYIAAGRSDHLNDIRSTIYAAGALTLFGILFRFGKMQINYITMDEGFSFTALRAVVRRSRHWIGLVVIVIAIVGGSSSISAFLQRLWERLVALKTPAEPPLPQIPQEMLNRPPMTPLELPESDSTPMNPLWLEKIAQITILLALSAFIGWLGWILYRLLRKYAPRFYRWLFAFWEMKVDQSATESDAYTDELERIEDKPKQSGRRSWLGKKVIPEDPAERVRYHYRQVLERAARKGTSLSLSDTPTQVSSKIDLNSPILHRLIDLYHRARYGQKSISEQEVRDWEQDAQHKK